MTDVQFFLLLTMAAAGVLTTIRIGNTTMANQQDLQAQLSQLEASSQATSASVNAAIQHLEAKIAAGAQPIDLQPEIDRLRAVLNLDTATNAAAQAVIAQG